MDTRLLKDFYLAHFSRPATDRPAYRAILHHKPQSILELGLGAGRRSLRMIELALRQLDGHPLDYVGIDLFEDRHGADGPGMSLRLAYQTLRRTGARVRLLPGSPWQALADHANALGRLDLIVVSSPADPQPMRRAWFYVPRLLHSGSIVLRESAPGAQGENLLEPVAHDEVARLAAQYTPHRRAA